MVKVLLTETKMKKQLRERSEDRTKDDDTKKEMPTPGEIID